MLESLYTWLLLPLGVVLGWVLARRTPSPPMVDGSEQLGGLLGRLGADDPDQALAALTEAADGGTENAELLLTLGNLLRRRGEVDRALRIHQALLARQQLPLELRHRARFELGQDYLKAGLIDRAQELFEELATQGLRVPESLEQILAIYEQGRDWQHAIETARRLEAAQGESRRLAIAQYFCELAEESRQQKQPDAAIRHARQAASEHAECVRAHLLLGTLYQAQAEYPAAIKAYRQVFDHDARFLPEVIEPLGQCYEKANDATGYLEFLADAKEQSESALPVVAEARLMREEGMDAMNHLAGGLETRPGRTVLVAFLEAMERRPEVVAAGLDKPAASLRSALRKLIDSSPRYRCSQCGFAPRQLFWQCPTCKQWGTTAPVEDLFKPVG